MQTRIWTELGVTSAANNLQDNIQRTRRPRAEMETYRGVARVRLGWHHVVQDMLQGAFAVKGQVDTGPIC